MKRIVITASIILFAQSLILLINVRGQTPTPTPSPTPATQPKKRIAMLVPYGYVDLPVGFKVTNTGGNVDYWYGSIESIDGKFVINFSAGTVESPLEKFKKHIVWTKYEKNSEMIPITTALVVQKKQETFLAKVFWTQFSAKVKDDAQKELFMEIIRSYRKTITKVNS